MFEEKFKKPGEAIGIGINYIPAISDSEGRIFYLKDFVRKGSVKELSERYKRNYKRIYIKKFVHYPEEDSVIYCFLKLMKDRKIKNLKIPNIDFKSCPICYLDSNPSNFPSGQSLWSCKACGSQWKSVISMAINILNYGEEL